eukprot:TRINITY_DN9158_c0_g1_i1.p3 TRINITY_DN9158_c0_g1~~TRINITY_DN9158_c0_g1_i1.p3  ORF type:complete len:108 (+),score=36.45 TRINITY_DN9158_c0_g1_i1:68-391(+)
MCIRDRSTWDTKQCKKRIVQKKTVMTDEDLEAIRDNEEFRHFVLFHDKLKKKAKYRDNNRRLLDHIKGSMDKVHQRLDDLKKKQNEKLRPGRTKMAKTMPVIRKKQP